MKKRHKHLWDRWSLPITAESREAAGSFGESMWAYNTVQYRTCVVCGYVECRHLCKGKLEEVAPVVKGPEKVLEMPEFCRN